MARGFKRSRRGSKKRVSRKGRFRARSAGKQRSWRKPSVYWFKRSTAVRDIASTTVGAAGLLDFKLTDLPSYSEFTPLFDAYRINKVVIQFTPNFVETNVSNGFTPSTQFIPDIGVAVDYDSQASNPTSMDELRQYATFRTYNANKPFTVTIVPRTSALIFKTALTSGYAESKPRLWLDLGDPSIPHYGLNYFMNPSGVNNQFNYRVTATYYIAFKGLR